MADNNKRYTDETEIIANTVPAELAENDDLVEYIQPSNLELLRARYAAIDEDEEIRNDGFELAKKSGLIRKQRPESHVYGYFSGPVNPKEEIRTDMDSPLSKVFDATRSEFDSDTVTFSDISFEQEKKDAEIKAETAPVEVEKPKKRATTVAEVGTQKPTEKPVRKRTKKNTVDTEVTDEKTKTTKAASQTADVVEKPKRTRTTRKVTESVEGPLPEVTAKQEEKPEAPPPVYNNRYGFDTHTRVIYVDESADDGIKRNSDDELSSLFSPENNQKKRRRLPWLQKRK